MAYIKPVYGLTKLPRQKGKMWFKLLSHLRFLYVLSKTKTPYISPRIKFTKLFLLKESAVVKA